MKTVGQEAAEKILHECLSAQEWVLMEDVDFNTEKAASIIDKIIEERSANATTPLTRELPPTETDDTKRLAKALVDARAAIIAHHHGVKCEICETHNIFKIIDAALPKMVTEPAGATLAQKIILLADKFKLWDTGQ